MHGLMWGAAAVALLLAVDVVRRWLARRRLADDPTGGPATVAIRLRGSSAPWPTRFRSGRLQRTARGAVAFVPTWRGEPLALGDLTLRSQGVHESNRLEVELRFTDSAGANVALRIHEPQFELARALLSQPGSAAPHRWPWPYQVGVCLSAVSVLVAVWAVLLSEPTTGTVVGRTDYGSCVVEWAEPDGSTAQDSVDCDPSTPDGSDLDIHVTAWPLRGHAMTDGFRYPAFLGLALLVCVPTAYLVSRRRRMLAMLDALAGGAGPLAHEPAVVDEVALEPLREHDLDWDSVVDRLNQRAAAEDWAAVGDSRDAPPIRLALGAARFRWWTVRPVVWSLWHPVAGMLTALLLLVAASAFLAPWALRARALTGPTAALTATVSTTPTEQLIPLLPWQPTEVEVSLDAGDGETTAWVAWAGPTPAPGTAVPVEVAVGDPSQARSTTQNGLTSALVVGGAAVLLLVLALAAGVRRRMQQLRSIAAALRIGGAPARYGISFAPDGTAYVLLAPADARGPLLPALGFEAAGRPIGAVPAAGTGVVHGDLGEGRWVVLEIGDHAVWPACPLLVVDSADDVLDWLNAWHGAEQDE